MSEMAKQKWTDYLSADVYGRLCNCCNTKSDLPVLVDARFAWMRTQEKYKGFTKEDAVVYILDLLDCNNQWQLCEITRDEYNDLCA